MKYVKTKSFLEILSIVFDDREKKQIDSLALLIFPLMKLKENTVPSVLLIGHHHGHFCFVRTCNSLRHNV